MKKIIAFAILALTLVPVTKAENVLTNNAASVSSVSGSVIDLQTGEALAGVTVKLIDSDKQTLTDLDGKFSFTNLPVGAHAIAVNYVSYQDKVQNIYVNPGQENAVKIELNNQLK